MDFLALFDIRALLLFVIVFSPLEYLLPIHPLKKILRKGLDVDLIHFFISGILIRIGFVFVIGAGVWVGDKVIPQAVKEAIGNSHLILQILLATVIADLGFYFAHRMMHANRILWRFHAVHHSSESLDWLAAYRVHPIDQLIVKGTAIVPIFILGFSNSAIVIAETIYLWQALLIHSNIKFSLGPLNRLIATPEFHHWHHSNIIESRDKNFAGQLAFVDMLFGTLHLPGKMPNKYGVDDSIPSTYLGQLSYPFIKLIRPDASNELVSTSEKPR